MKLLALIAFTATAAARKAPKKFESAKEMALNAPALEAKGVRLVSLMVPNPPKSNPSPNPSPNQVPNPLKSIPNPSPNPSPNPNQVPNPPKWPRQYSFTLGADWAEDEARRKLFARAKSHPWEFLDAGDPDGTKAEKRRRGRRVAQKPGCESLPQIRVRL